LHGSSTQLCLEVVVVSTRSTFLLAVLASIATPLSAQDTLRFEPTIGYPTFAVREPVATITPGTVIISRTMHGDYYNPGGGAFPGEVGPFYVEGATTNDMLRVEIIRVPNRKGTLAWRNFQYSVFN
jgi:hypothetical protein